MEEKDEVREAIQQLSEKEQEAFLEVNEKISERRTYGIRTVEIPEEHTILSWSNGAESWNVTGWQTNNKEAGDKVELDANQIIVPYSQDVVYEFIEYLRPLPLYKYSTEAKARGQVDPLEATIGWLETQLKSRKQKE